jgi:alpha-L-fucosidase
MYKEGSNAYRCHVQKYGHPSKFGFKDVIRRWQAAQWDPDALLALYRKAGARYFVALANHHDNFDLYDSRFQPEWNSTRIGPKKDLIAGWAKAARAQGHPLSRKTTAPAEWGAQWDWGGGATLPPRRYVENFHDRTVDLIDRYDPDLVYFDDTALPFCPFSDAGLRIAAHLYNRSIATRGRLEAVINGKMLDERQRRSSCGTSSAARTRVHRPSCTCWSRNRDRGDGRRAGVSEEARGEGRMRWCRTGACIPPGGGRIAGHAAVRALKVLT